MIESKTYHCSLCGSLYLGEPIWSVEPRLIGMRYVRPCRCVDEPEALEDYGAEVREVAR